MIADIYEDFQKRVIPLGIETECVGGGRIEHSENKLFVYGYSMVLKYLYTVYFEHDMSKLHYYFMKRKVMLNFSLTFLSFDEATDLEDN